MPQSAETRRKKYRENAEFRRNELLRRKEHRKNSERPWHRNKRTCRVVGDKEAWVEEAALHRFWKLRGKSEREMYLSCLRLSLELAEGNADEALARIIRNRIEIIECGPITPLKPFYTTAFVVETLGLSRDEFLLLEKKGIIPQPISRGAPNGGRLYSIDQIMLMVKAFASSILPGVDPDSEKWKAGCRNHKPRLKTVFNLGLVAKVLHEGWNSPLENFDDTEAHISILTGISWYRHLAKELKALSKDYGCQNLPFPETDELFTAPE